MFYCIATTVSNITTDFLLDKNFDHMISWSTLVFKSSLIYINEHWDLSFLDILDNYQQFLFDPSKMV